MEQSFAKSIIRRKMIQKRNVLSHEETLHFGNIVASFILELTKYKKCKSIMVYFPKDNEIDTGKIISHSFMYGKRVIFPRYNSQNGGLEARSVCCVDRDLSPGSFGIMEPESGNSEIVSLQDIELILIPCVAVNKQGYRIGRGGGCYDRFLSFAGKHNCKIGLVYDFQYVTDFEVQEHDIPLDMIISNKGIRHFEKTSLIELRKSDKYKKERCNNGKFIY
ncbi:MAG: 5-formyltetrahydrofolate cyclo-ligase [Candidatus Theseobacter exili]|nr:5-formyltetrahydrofolate cyclo-ligase [Candidatus Theseobacter exili]